MATISEMRMLRVAFILFAAFVSAAFWHGAPTGLTTWAPLKIGGGGFISGLDLSSDGTSFIIRTDTYGGYVCASFSSSKCTQWNQIVSTASLPGAAAFVDNAQGIYEIAIAPNTPTRLYMIFRAQMYRSDDRGASWTLLSGFTTISPASAAAPNDSFRRIGRRIVVDPQNSNVVYAGTSTALGLQVSYDAGVTWANIASIAASSGNAGIIIATDSTSGTTTCPGGVGLCINKIYASSYGTGVYASTDGGATWGLTTNTPTTHQHMIVSSAGVPFLLDNSSAPAKVYKYTASAWSDISPGGTNTWRAIAVDPNNAERLVLVSNQNMSSTLTATSTHTWTFVPSSTYSPTCTAGIDASQLRSASDIPWLGPSGTKECAFTIGDLRFDPNTANLLHLSEGVGVWSMTFGTASTMPNTTQTWTSETAGIEQLVANWVLSPPSGSPITFSWDRAIFYKSSPNTYPSAQTWDITKAILPGWGGDYAVTDSSFIVAVVNTAGTQDSGYSSDGGQTWTVFASTPTSATAGKNAGSIAAYDHNLFVWCPNDNGNPAYSKDGAASWTDLDFSAYSIPTTGETGWGFSSLSTNRHVCVVDRVTPRTFYLYNYGPSGHTGVAGVYRVVFDVGGTPTVTRAISGTLVAAGVASGFNASMRSVPGKAGELFFTAGQISGSTAGVFSHLVDSGAAGDNTMTATATPSVLEVYAFGHGATKPGNNYPSAYIAGFVDKGSGYTYSIYRCDAAAATWAANTVPASCWIDLGASPLNSFDTPKAIEGDANIYGTVYIGWLGSGFGVGTLH